MTHTNTMPSDGGSGWIPISLADKTIVDVIEFPSVNMTIRNSAPILARDEDGRIYEAIWTDHKGGYWWDLDAEDRVDPVEFQNIIHIRIEADGAPTTVGELIAYLREDACVDPETGRRILPRFIDDEVFSRAADLLEKAYFAIPPQPAKEVE